MKNFKDGQKIRVSGEVKYGDKYYRVACHGTMVDNKRGKYALCTLDDVDGDENVTVMVNKRFIHERNAEKPKRVPLHHRNRNSECDCYS